MCELSCGCSLKCAADCDGYLLKCAADCDGYLLKCAIDCDGYLLKSAVDCDGYSLKFAVDCDGCLQSSDILVLRKSLIAHLQLFYWYPSRFEVTPKAWAPDHHLVFMT